MAKINSSYQKLQAGYLFPEIGKRVRAGVEQIAAEKARGDSVWPVIEYADIAAGTVTADQLARLRQRGCLVVRGDHPVADPLARIVLALAVGGPGGERAVGLRRRARLERGEDPKIGEESKLPLAAQALNVLEEQSRAAGAVVDFHGGEWGSREATVVVTGQRENAVREDGQSRRSAKGRARRRKRQGRRFARSSGTRR